MATPISSDVKDKNSIFTARNEDMIFSKRKNPGISTVSIYVLGRQGVKKQIQFNSSCLQLILIIEYAKK